MVFATERLYCTLFTYSTIETMPQSSYIVYIRNKRNEVTSKSVCNMTANNMLYNLYVKYADIKNESYK